MLVNISKVYFAFKYNHLGLVFYINLHTMSMVTDDRRCVSNHFDAPTINTHNALGDGCYMNMNVSFQHAITLSSPTRGKCQFSSPYF